MTAHAHLSPFRLAQFLPIADVRNRWHDLEMKWITALRWATPVWVVAIGAVGAALFLTDFAMEVGTEEAVKRLALVAIVALPLIAFVLKATSDDVVRFRVAFPAKDVERSDH